MANQSFLGRGWSFPPLFNSAKGEVIMSEHITDVQSSLEILFSTIPGERVMFPKYGCNLDPMLFESLDTRAKTLLKDTMETAILLYEPRIRLHSIDFHSDNELEGTILIEVSYSIKSTNTRHNLVFPFYKAEATNAKL